MCCGHVHPTPLSRPPTQFLDFFLFPVGPLLPHLPPFLSFLLSPFPCPLPSPLLPSCPSSLLLFTMQAINQNVRKRLEPGLPSSPWIFPGSRTSNITLLNTWRVITFSLTLGNDAIIHFGNSIWPGYLFWEETSFSEPITPKSPHPLSWEGSGTQESGWSEKESCFLRTFK